jgi:Orsellinic acid/F9775 biosynthesis cluster protein D
MSEQYIKYVPQLRVMLCCLCKEGITKNGIAWHYREHHKDVPLRERKGVVKYSNNFDVCTRKEFEYPTTTISRIEDIIVENGLQCLYNNCNHACIRVESMITHCKVDHGWVASKGITLKYMFLTVCQGVMWVQHDVQSIFKGQGSKYFAVRTTPLLDDADLDDFLQQALAAADLRDIEEARQKNIIVPETQTERTSRWTTRAGFLQMLAGKNLTELYPLTSARVDMDNEPELEHIQRSVPNLIEQCLEGVKDWGKRGWEVLHFWLNSTQMGSACDKPFQVYYSPSTIARYSEFWLRFILFTLRTINANAGENDVKYTRGQRKALKKLKKIISKESPTDFELYSQLLRVSKLFISQKDFENDSPSPIKYFCCVMGWDSAKEVWRRPGTYTPFLAAMQFCMRVLVCEIVLPREKKDNYRKVLNPLKLFKKRWKKWLVEGSAYPFNWVHKLMQYGLNVAKDEMGENQIRFSHDKKYLYWQGRELNIDSWRHFPGDILRTTEKLLSRELLFRSTDFVESFNPYEIEENENCKDNKHWFGDYIAEYAKTGRNTIMSNLGGQIKEMGRIEGGQWIWDPVAVNRYKRSHEKLKEYFVIGFNTLGGLAGRGPEMLSIQYYNTPGTHRHVTVQDGQLVVETQYHKCQNVTDSVKVQSRAFFTNI